MHTDLLTQSPGARVPQEPTPGDLLGCRQLGTSHADPTGHFLSTSRVAGWKLEARRQVRTSWAIEGAQPRKEATREVGTDLHASTVQLVTHSLPFSACLRAHTGWTCSVHCGNPGPMWVFTCYLPLLRHTAGELADVVLVLTPVTHRGLGKEMIFFTQAWPLEASQRTPRGGRHPHICFCFRWWLNSLRLPGLARHSGPPLPRTVGQAYHPPQQVTISIW